MIPGTNEIFPGFYKQKKQPENIVFVTKVGKGLVSVQGSKGELLGALMSSQEFMSQFEKIPERK